MSDSASDWPGPDENRTIAEMIAQSDSPLWDACDAWIDVTVAELASDLQKSDRDGIANEVKLKVRIGLPSFQYRSKLKTWIIRILKNEKANFYRRGNPWRNETSLEVFMEEYGHLEPIVYDPTRQQDINRDLLRRVLEAMRRFVLKRKDRKRAADIIQHWLEGAKPAEIAALLGISAQTVSNTLYALRLYLQHLAAEWFGETDSPDPPDSD